MKLKFNLIQFGLFRQHRELADCTDLIVFRSCDILEHFPRPNCLKYAHENGCHSKFRNNNV